MSDALLDLDAHPDRLDAEDPGLARVLEQPAEERTGPRPDRGRRIIGPGPVDRLGDAGEHLDRGAVGDGGEDPLAAGEELVEVAGRHLR